MALMRFSFLSEILGYHTNVNVILPFEGKRNEDMSPDVSEKYPVLYLLHGGGGNQDDWIRYTSVERYAQEKGIAVVMPDVSGSSFYADMVHGYRYFTYISEELPKIVEGYFPIGGSREKRFVAGLSMGGYGSLKWGILRPEFFSHVANMSGASLIVELFNGQNFGQDKNNRKASLVDCAWGGMDKLAGSESDTAYLLEKAATMKDKLPKLFVCIGTEDFSYQYTCDFMAYANKLGLEIQYEEMPGEHNWDVWDHFLVRFMDICLGE